MSVTLVLLPGMDGTGDLFAGFLAALPADVRARAIAYPTDEPLGYAALERFVRARLPAEGAFVLLAESFSGPVAVAVAASPPPGLRGLILCCSFLRAPRRILRLLGPLAARLPVHAVPPAVTARFLLGRSAEPHLRHALARAVGRVAPQTFRARLRAVAEVDAAAALAQIRVPVLWIRATEDRVVPDSASDGVADACPSLRVTDVEGPHLLLQAEPAAAAREIVRFLSDVGP